MYSERGGAPLEEARVTPHAGGMSNGVKRRATYSDLEAVPADQVAELLEGELYASPRPASPHVRAAGRLFGMLSEPFDRGRGGPGGWLLLPEPELHLGEDVVVPDLAGWRRERMPEMPHVTAFTVVPDWVCEVLSPSTVVVDREKKMALYAREGIGHVWLVEPLERELEVYRLEGRRWKRQGVHKGEVCLPVEPFEALPLELGALWAR